MITLKTTYKRLVSAFGEYSNGMDGSKTMKDHKVLLKAARKFRDALVGVEKEIQLMQQTTREKMSGLDQVKDSKEIQKFQAETQELSDKSANSELVIEVMEEELKAFYEAISNLKIDKLSQKQSSNIIFIDEFTDDCELVIK